MVEEVGVEVEVERTEAELERFGARVILERA